MPTGETLAGQVGGLNKSIHAQRSPLLRLPAAITSSIAQTQYGAFWRPFPSRCNGCGRRRDKL
jgi:hypothetical protein